MFLCAQTDNILDESIKTCRYDEWLEKVKMEWLGKGRWKALKVEDRISIKRDVKAIVSDSATYFFYLFFC